MKKCFFMLAAVACCACSKGVTSSYEEKNEVVELNFSVPVAATKVSGTVVEDAVERLQVFVFGMDGCIQSSGIADENTLTLTCTTGEKMIAAVVNAPAVNDIKTLPDLETSMSRFEDNSLGCFVMSGMDRKTLSSSGPVEIPVSRKVSKVTLSSVSSAFKLPQHQAMDFELLSMFLTNVPEQVGYFAGLQSDTFINDGEDDMSVLAASGNLLYDDLGGIHVVAGIPTEIGNSLYCYPNMLKNPEKPAYLVVQARLGNGIYYYTVRLPWMESNKCYNVSLTATMPGSLTPDVPVKKEEASFSVTVSDWAGNISVNETI